jgi:nucleotide-binding universal stress UspA family protein
MSGEAIVVGVDVSPEAAHAASLAAHLAESAKASCYLVHAIHHSTPPPPELLQDPSAGYEQSAFARARDKVVSALWGLVPPELLEQVLIRPGRAPEALREAATELDAGLIVIGGRRHGALGALPGRSTAMSLLRTVEVPLLVAQGSALPHRILAAVDSSAAARPTLEAAERYAQLLRATLRVLSVIEPLPLIPGLPVTSFDPQASYDEARSVIEHEIWPLVGPEASREVRFGGAVEAILAESRRWSADLLVVGTHGKGWIERMIIGSVAERLLRVLPTSLLVVPAYAALEANQGKAPEEAQWGVGSRA